MVFFLTTLDGVGFVGVLVPLLALVVPTGPLPFALDDDDALDFVFWLGPMLTATTATKPPSCKVDATDPTFGATCSMLVLATVVSGSAVALSTLFMVLESYKRINTM